ncbi:hypothetical protein [Agromyces sp. NPDC058126]|uniref:hypothetical protein n=1 Tax=Agromyces sp. NPDC058126 TaxID=3346350 RepID=UPI0036D8D25A
MSRVAHSGRLVVVIGGLIGAGVLAAAVVTAGPGWWSQPTPTQGSAAPETDAPAYRWTLPPAVTTGAAPPQQPDGADAPDPAPAPIPDAPEDFSADAFDLAAPDTSVEGSGRPGTDREGQAAEGSGEREYRWVLVSENPNVASGFTTTFGILMSCVGGGEAVRSIIEHDLGEHFIFTLYYSPREVVYLAAGSYLCGTPTDVQVARDLADRADATWGTSGLTATHPGVCILYRAVRSVVDGQAGASYTCPSGPPPPFPDEGTYTADLYSLFTASEAAVTPLPGSGPEGDPAGLSAEDPATAGDAVIVLEASAEHVDLSTAGPDAEEQAPAGAEPPESPAEGQALPTADAPALQPAAEAHPIDPASTEDAGVPEPDAPAEAPAPTEQVAVPEPDAPADVPAGTEVPTDPLVEPAQDPGA